MHTRAYKATATAKTKEDKKTYRNKGRRLKKLRQSRPIVEDVKKVGSSSGGADTEGKTEQEAAAKKGEEEEKKDEGERNEDDAVVENNGV